VAKKVIARLHLCLYLVAQSKRQSVGAYLISQCSASHISRVFTASSSSDYNLNSHLFSNSAPAMAPTTTMAHFLAPSTRSKRKQETIVDTEVGIPEKEHHELVQSRKKPRTAKMATKPINEPGDEFEGESAGDEKQKTKAPKRKQSVKSKAINGKATPKVNTDKDAKATRK
jgi:hypothetical protein